MEAKVLFFLLVAAQDDTGYFPWERMKVRTLVATCSWTFEQATIHARTLVDGGMASWEEGGIVLRNGQALNGQNRSDRQPLFYQRSTTDIPVTDSGIPVTPLEREGEGDGERDKKPPISPLKGESNFELPSWVNKETWDSFLEMRVKTKAPPTLDAKKLLVKKLLRLRDAGNDPNEVLEQSIMNNYKGVFAINERQRSVNGKSEDSSQLDPNRPGARFADPQWQGVGMGS
ncbi:MAG: hypothetical protein U0990_00995 [Candidatus Nanopelagicales bacterium]|nr:hypothetical protein [Candidatus Nanopelagicales bacterium]